MKLKTICLIAILSTGHIAYADTESFIDTETRYGPIFKEHNNNSGSKLIYQGKTLIQPQNGDAVVFVEGIYQVNDVDIIPAMTANGGNSQIEYQHYLVAIKPDQSTEVLSDKAMISPDRQDIYQLQDGKFVAEYDRATVTFDGNQFQLLAKEDALNNIPDEDCQSLYEDREDLIQAGKEDYLSMADMRYFKYLERYKAFSQDNLIKNGSDKKLSYEAFKNKICTLQ